MFWNMRRARGTRRSKARQSLRQPAARFVPSVEQLETRDVPASASFAAGVLTVNGTAGAGSVVLKLANNRVSITGITRTFDAANVDSIVVNANAGNDTVSLVGLTAQWNKPITVRSTGGNDTIRLLSGRSIYISGPGQNFSIDGAGTMMLSGRSLELFDYNTHDAALRQLLHY